MEQITIAGHPFNVPLRYEEGHELTAGEAQALNQTYHENLRNNFAKKVKEHVEKGGKHHELQPELDKYAHEYQFGVRTGGGGVSRDPVMSMAMRIAKKKITELIAAKGKKAKDYEPAAITAAAKALLERPEGHAIIEVARARVEEEKNLASGNLGDLLEDLAQKPVHHAEAEVPQTSAA